MKKNKCAYKIIMNFITRKKIISLCEIAITLDYHSDEHIYFSNRIICNNTNYVFSSNEINQIVNKKIIYLDTNIFDLFIDQILNKIYKPFILITLNNFQMVDKYKIILENICLLRWYCQNIRYNHYKLKALPVGINNIQCKNENFETLKKIIKNENLKEMLLYANVPGKHHHALQKHDNILQKHDNLKYELTCGNNVIKKSDLIHPNINNSEYELYLTELSKCKFIMCLHTNETDCHCMWEALYLGTIPIVKKNILYDQFDDLPILFIDEHNILTEEYLNVQYQLMSTKEYCLDKLFWDYWKNTINNNLFVNVVIPVCSLHIKYLDNCIKSLNNQTRFPNKVIFVLNEYAKYNKIYENIMDLLNKNIHHECIKINTWEKPGPNRNIGSKHIIASEDSIIIYHDVDDLMHKQRCELVEKCFYTYNCDMLLHLAFQDYEKINDKYDIKNVILSDTINDTLKDINFFNNNSSINFSYYFGDRNNKNGHSKLHHGQCCISTNILKTIQWSDLHSGEDLQFVSDATREYKNTVILLAPLVIVVGRDNIRLIDGSVCHKKKLIGLKYMPNLK